MDPIVKNNVRVSGNPDAARTLLFVNGFGTEQSVWDAVASAFEGEFRVVRFDNAGGRGADPQAFVQHRYLNLHGYAADLVDILQALDLQDAFLVGHSLGAMIAVLATLKEPARVGRLVLIGASPRYLDDVGYHGGFTYESLNEIYRAMTVEYTHWADGFAPQVMANPERPHLARDFAAGLKAVPQDRALTVLCSIFQSDHRADVARLDKPVLLLQSQDDVAVPLEVAQFLHATIRGSRLEVIPASGHLPHISAPDIVVQAMRDFLLAP